VFAVSFNNHPHCVACPCWSTAVSMAGAGASTILSAVVMQTTVLDSVV